MSTRVLRAPTPRWAGVGPSAVVLSAGTAALAAAAAVLVGPPALAIPVAVVAGVLLVREPIGALTLFIWVGLYKEQAIVQAAPVDVTLALAVLLAAVCFFRWASGRVLRVPLGLVAPVVAISVMLVVSLAWTPSPDYGGDKALKFVTLTLVATLAPFFLIESERDLRRYFSWTVILAVVTAAFTVANPPASDGRLTLGIEGNTIGISHLLCTAALVLLIGALTDLISSRRLAIVASIALVAVAAAIGSRGPLLSLVLALAITGTVWLTRVPRKVLPVLVVVAVGVAVLPLVSLPESSAQRLDRAASDPVATVRADPRYTSFGDAIDLIERHPILGVGAGGFKSVGDLETPPESWPHNMLLEVWSELGLAAVLVLVASIVALLVGLWRGAWSTANDRLGPLLYVLSAYFLFNLFQTMVSGDLNQNRAFWGVFGLAWLIVQHGVPSPRGELDGARTGS